MNDKNGAAQFVHIKKNVTVDFDVRYCLHWGESFVSSYFCISLLALSLFFSLFLSFSLFSFYDFIFKTNFISALFKLWTKLHTLMGFFPYFLYRRLSFFTSKNNNNNKNTLKSMVKTIFINDTNVAVYLPHIHIHTNTHETHTLKQISLSILFDVYYYFTNKFFFLLLSFQTLTKNYSIQRSNSFYFAVIVVAVSIIFFFFFFGIISYLRYSLLFHCSLLCSYLVWIFSLNEMSCC